ncbi:tripartite motif-containing protein 45-like [Mya arenaria]|uniref:tripartite motif-containing protein 45-like n=1 Tax=Mya arenaria TaxID=6604 RepID=UPI0022E03E94|nr:tripartite motif-containing protein 45-like [Mya arenaria]
MEVPGKKSQAGPSTANTTYCQPCEQDDEILPAEAFCTVCKEFFCSKCASLHRKQKMSRSHTLLNKSDMPTAINVIQDEYERTELCEIHPKEIIKYFCPTHHNLNCGHCLVNNHRSCDVKFISDILKAFKDGQEYGDIINTISSLFEDIDSFASDVENNIDVVAKLGENEVSKLRRYREEVIKYFEEREQALLKFIEKTKNMDGELLGSLKPKYKNLRSKLEEINVTLKAQENNMIQMFIETKKAKNLLHGLQNDLADIRKDNVIHHYEFRKDLVTERLIASDTGLGTLEHTVTKPHKTASASGISKTKDY